MIEEIPESDKLNGCPHPRKTLNFFGHKKIQSEVLNSIANKKIHHAWLLCGPKGIGKATLAWRIAHTLLTLDYSTTNFNNFNSNNELEVSRDNPIYQRTLALTEPKLHLLRKGWDPKTEKFRQSISIEEIRALKKFFNLSSTDNGSRVVIIDSADDLQTASANALLKILEEPPAKTTILIICHNASLLLPTIKSRCRILKFKPLNSTNLQQGINQALNIDSKMGNCISELAQGSIGNGIYLLNNNGTEIYQRLCALFSTPSELNRTKVIELASNFTNKSSMRYFDILISLLSILINRLVLSGAGAHPKNEAIENEFQVLNKLAPNLKSAKIWSEQSLPLLKNAIKANNVNIDPSSVILDLILKLNQIAEKIQLAERK